MVLCFGFCRLLDGLILDGFIMNDDNGNYSRGNDSEAIREAFEHAAENAAMRESYAIRISSNHPSISFVDNLYHQNTLRCQDFTLSQPDFVLKLWVNKKALSGDECIVINDTMKVKVSTCEVTDKGKIQQYIIDYYHQLLKDMIRTLRNIQDESSLKEEAKRIEDALSTFAATFVQITAQPAELAQLEGELQRLLNSNNNNEEQDAIEDRVLKLKHYKKVRASWKGHRVIVNQFNNTLKALKDLLREILTGATRMQEIRQHILDLHFSKKHAKRLNKLILTDEQLMKRQQMYDNIRGLEETDDIGDLSDELGCGCFLSTMTLKECAMDGQALWLCGRVNRSGGVMVSNPEIVRIEYISPDLVSNEYFEMAMDITNGEGFNDGSRNIVNARLFPIYGGNEAYFAVSKPYLLETLSHTLSGRGDIKMNDYSTLSAVLGYMIASHVQSTKNLHRMLSDIVPSYALLAKHLRVFPYENDKNKEIDFKAKDKIELAQLFERRLRRYCSAMRVRCSSLISNVQCLFGDALLCNQSSLLVQNTVVWLSMVAQRLRSLIKARIPGDQNLFTQARQAEVNHAQALRVIIRGSDMENDVFDDAKQDDDQMLRYFETQYAIQKEKLSNKSKERLSPFDICECKALTSDDIDLSDFDPYKITPSQIELCAQILARTYFGDLIQAHRFFRIFNKMNEENVDVIQNLDQLKCKKTPRRWSDLCDELGCALSMVTLRALCGFILVIFTNSSFQNPSHCGVFEELITKPSVIIQFLHEKVIAESRRKPRRMVARIKHKPSSPVDLAKRRQHANIVPHCITTSDSLKWDYWKTIDLSTAAQMNVSIVGHHLSGKSTLLGRLLFDLHAVSDRFYKQKQKQKLKNTNEFSNIVNNRQTDHETMCAVVKSKDSSSLIRIHDTPNPAYYKNVMKTLGGTTDALILCVAAPRKEFAQSMQRIHAKKGIFVNGATVSLPHCMKALVDSEIVICCVTKMDRVAYGQKEYLLVKDEMSKMLSKRGYDAHKLIFFPVCSLQGNESKMMPWFEGFEITLKDKKYSGDSLYDALDLLSTLKAAKIAKKKKKAFKALITGKMRIKGVGCVLSAAVKEGCCAVGDEVKFLPSGVTTQIKTMQKYYKSVADAICGDAVAITINASCNDIMVGDVVCRVKEDQHVNMTRQVDALVFVANLGIVDRIRAGYKAHLYCGSDHVPCTVKQIKWKKVTKNGGKKTDNPVYMQAGDQAHVVLTLQKPMAISKFDEFKCTGRFVAVSG
eukprot:111597_1